MAYLALARALAGGVAKWFPKLLLGGGNMIFTVIFMVFSRLSRALLGLHTVVARRFPVVTIV